MRCSSESPRQAAARIWFAASVVVQTAKSCELRIGAALAAVILLIARGSAPILIAGSLFGVMLGRHIENGPTAVAYSGTQFTLAMLVDLVPDSYIAPDPDAAIARLAGIVIGVALLEPVLAAFHVFGVKSAVAAKDDAS